MRRKIGVSLTSVLFVVLAYLIYKIVELEGWTYLTTIAKWVFYISAGYVAVTIALVLSIILLGVVALIMLKRAKNKGFNVVVDKKFPFKARKVPIDAEFKVKE